MTGDDSNAAPTGSGGANWFETAAAKSGLTNERVSGGSAGHITLLSEPAALTRPQEVIETIARFLQRVHSIDVGGEFDIPSMAPSVALKDANERTEAGQLAGTEFDSPYTGQAAQRLVSVAESFLPQVPNPVVLVGYTSILDLGVSNGEVVSWPTPLRAGIGDPYMDLTFLGAAVANAIGPAAVPALFDAYGISSPELKRVEFWSLIYQLRSRDLG